MMAARTALATALLFAAAVGATEPIIDRNGLAFVSGDAFCRFHCSPLHAVKSGLTADSECTPQACGATPHHARSLLPRDGVAMIDVVTCQSREGDRLGVSLTVGDPTANAFAGFHDAFFRAYDAMISSADATVEACQLQFLQDELLATASKSDSPPPKRLTNPPMLVRLAPTGDERACLTAVRSLWTIDDERFTPFLTRSDQTQANATVLLLHLPNDVASKVAALDCVARVVQLPVVLKLTPFARATATLGRSNVGLTGGPSLDVRLVKGSRIEVIASRLQAQLTTVLGIQNAISYDSKDASTLTLQALSDYQAWTKAVAVLLEDDAVEWVDLHASLSTGSLAPGASFEQQLMAHYPPTPSAVRGRRLDAYVQDIVGITPVRARNITGAGLVVGVIDTGLYVYHDQFAQPDREIYDNTNLKARKVVLYKTFANDRDESEAVKCGHGTHVSGLLAGSSLSGANEDLGIAHSARIAFMDIGKQSATCAGQSGCAVDLKIPDDMDALMKDQVDAGARVFSFSWGTGANDYNALSRDLDDYVYNHPEILIVVAAGNSGEKGAHTISSPSGAKNVISVGASLNDAASFSDTPCPSTLNKQTVATFSSMGPTLDGRLKPDLVAPGMIIKSAQSEAPGQTVASSALCPLQGTSQATPVVAGMAVLLYEWLRDGWWRHGVKDPQYSMKTIPAALLKALLMHSGEKMSRRLVAPRNGVTSCVAMEAAAEPLSSYPDVIQGYGKPTMDNLVSFKDDVGAGVYFFPNSTNGSEPRVAEGEEAKFTFMLTSDANLRVTLVWTDPAGSVGGKIALQNDLDLSVRIPNTDTIFYPLSGNGSRDSLNNVEMVEVSYAQVVDALKATKTKYDATTGIVVEAVVHGFSVKAGASKEQAFALVASSSPSSVETAGATRGSTSSWKPWMTMAIAIAATLLVLLVIAVGWRKKAASKRDEMRDRPSSPAVLATPPTDTAYHSGFVLGVSRPEPSGQASNTQDQSTIAHL